MMKNSRVDLIAFGEILWDIIDDVPHLGGAPFNLAAHAALCGVSTAMISALGVDTLGEMARVRAHELGIDTRWIIHDQQNPTGSVTVTLSNTIPSYTIHENAAWDNIVLTDAAVDSIIATHPKAFCFGTLAQRSKASAATLYRILEHLKDSLIFFDVNLRQKFWNSKTVADSIAKCNWLKVNEDEAKLLNRELFLTDPDVERFADIIFAKFKRVAGIAVTCGANGCIVFERGKAPLRAAGIEVTAVDTIGAGDAFSAAFLAELLHSGDVRKAMHAANQRGALIASRQGAIPVIQSCCK